MNLAITILKSLMIESMKKNIILHWENLQALTRKILKKYDSSCTYEEYYGF